MFQKDKINPYPNKMPPIVLNNGYNYSIEQRVHLAKKKIERNSTKGIKDSFRRAFPFSNKIPSKQIIDYQKKKFTEEGSCRYVM